MKISAIICEYNPMHNGHMYHIQKTRENGATHIIGILSSNFVQRGDVSLLDKFDRADLALRAGMDLVIELPVVFSSASAELYGTGAVSLLQQLGVAEELSFGSSCLDLESLELLTDAKCSTTTVYRERVLERMRAGESYPVALSEIIRQRYGGHVADLMHDPNNVLAIEYMSAMQRLETDFTPYNVQRQCVMHDSMTPNQMYASASFVRKSVAEGNFYYLDYVPACTAQMISKRQQEGKLASLQQLERAILYRMRTISSEELLALPDVGETLQHRIQTAARQANSLPELMAGIKTKAYTMARIRRILMNAMIGMTKEDHRCVPPYARVLAFNAKGREILAEMKRKSSIPVSTSLAKLRETGSLAARFVALEAAASDVYGLAQGSIGSAEQDFRAKITAGGAV